MKNLKILLLLLVTFCDATELSIQTYPELQQYANGKYVSAALEEINRAFQEAELIHGKLEVDHVPAKEIFNQLKNGGYTNSRIWLQFPMENLVFENGLFKLPDLSNLEAFRSSKYPEIPIDFIRKAFQDSMPPVRLYALEYLTKNPEVKLLESILNGFIEEKEEFLELKYGELLRLEPYLSESAKEIQPSLIQKIEKYSKSNLILDHRANALFFAIQYTKLRPEADIPTLITMMDSGYPVKFLVRLFTEYPISLLESFITPFREGYGDKWELLLEIFSNFSNSKSILETMYYALEHRKEAHFASFQDKIITVWEKVSQIPFEGDLIIYRDWINKKFKN